MSARQYNFRASPVTIRQLEQLADWWGTNQAETIARATMRAYLEEELRHSAWRTDLSDEELDARSDEQAQFNDLLSVERWSALRGQTTRCGCSVSGECPQALLLRRRAIEAIYECRGGAMTREQRQEAYRAWRAHITAAAQR